MENYTELLSDSELESLVGTGSPDAAALIDGLPPRNDWTPKNGPIQPCSVDLHVGRIQIANDSDGDERVLAGNGDEVSLDTGKIAVITTKETLHLPANIAAIGFPPSHVSFKGLLMTNPGHVDPGYSGPMRFAVINMAKQPYALKVGQDICTLLFFRLKNNVKSDYQQRGGGPGTAASREDVNRVGRDFGSVETRAKKISEEAVHKSTLWAVIIAFIVSAGITMVSQSIPYWLGGVEDAKRNYAVAEKQIENLERRVQSLEQSHSPTSPVKVGPITRP